VNPDAAINIMDKKYYKPIVITFSVAVLNLIFGFDPKFTIINLIWLLPFKSAA
jgi:hypothetical protein